MMEEKNKFQKEIEVKFQKMLEQAETDPQLRDEVFSTISKIEAAATLIDLFTIKFAKTEGSIIENLNIPFDNTKE